MRTTAPVLILDGGLGTTLEDKYNVRFSSAETPLWSSHLLLTDQRRLLACHGDFAAAGADIISTATYQASVAGFAATRTPDWTIGVSLPRVSEFLEDAVRVALGAAQENGHHTSVALTLGPYGATVVPSQEYGGVYDHDHSGLSALMAWHFERIMLFAKIPHLLGQVEYVAFETIPRIDEVMAIRQVMGDRDLRASSPKHWPTRHGGLDGDLTLPFWISCVYPGDEDVLELPDGTPVDEVVHAMLSGEVSGVVPWGIGINCTKVGKLPALVRQYESVISRMVRSGELKTWPSLVLYPDGTNGEVYNTTTQKWELPKGKKPPNKSWESQVSDLVKETQSRGRWRSIVVGGCCKTSPDDIARLRAAIIPAEDGDDSHSDENQPLVEDGIAGDGVGCVLQPSATTGLESI